MENKASVHSDLPIPPGEFLEEVIEDLGLSREELARGIGWFAGDVSELFRGMLALDDTTAVRLEQAVGVPAHIWTGLEQEFRLVLSKEGKPRS